MTIGSRSSEKANPPLAGRWLIPSIGDLIFVALLGLLGFTTLSVRLLGDAGIGWHIRTGQLILATHSIPRVDPFSSTMAGHPWFAWEWLYDVFVGWLDSAAGLNGVVFLTAAIIALTFSWSFRLLLRRGANFLVALGLVLLAASAAMIHFLARPHVVSWLFAVLWFWILESSQNKQPGSFAEAGQGWLLWLIPLLTLVWVNTHGGFLLGFALLGIYWLSAVWDYFRLKDDRLENLVDKIRAGKRARKLALIGVFSTLTTLMNPYGWRLHVHIYRYLSNRFLMDHIDEFQSPNFHGAAQKCFALLLLLTLIGLATKGRGRSDFTISELLLTLFAVYSGLYASRNIPVSALLLILVIGPRLSPALQPLQELWAGWRVASGAQATTSPDFFHRMQVIESSLHAHLWPVVAIVLTCWITFHDGRLGVAQVMDAHFDSKRFPADAITYLESQKAEGPVFAPDNWGGYLIYRVYPQIKVAVDDRHDFYGEQFLKSYLNLVHVEPGWKNFLQRYPVRYVVSPKGSALASILAESAIWQPVYSDQVAVIFVLAKPTTR